MNGIFFKKYYIVHSGGLAHGGNDPGAVGSAFLEKDKNLQISKYMANRFKELGVPFSMTRDTDESLSNTERVNRMKRPFGDVKNAIVVSNHINAGGGEGAEVIYPLRDTSNLSESILDELGKAGQIKRSVYQRSLPNDPSKDYHYIMRDTNNLPMVIVEYGFIDNTADIRKLQSDWESFAEATVKAVTEYMGYPYEEEPMQDVYAVKAGDTLYGIARRFNTTVQNIKELNNLQNDTLSIGQLLVIKKAKEETTTEDTYTVRPNDTLYSISRTLNTTVDELKRVNNLTNNLLSIGQILKIPNGKATQEVENYIVKRGDTLYGIAQRFNTTVSKIKSVNNLSSEILSIGQNLIIPNGKIEQEEKTYIVKSGDTLWGIGNQFNVSVEEIKRVNNLTSNILSIGKVLTIP